MQLRVYRSLWGLEDDPARYPQAIEQIASEGFDGVVAPVQLIGRHAGEVRATLEGTGLGLVGQVFTGGATPADHLSSLAEALDGAAELAPAHIVAHAGRDGWPADVSLAFLAEALDVQRRSGLVVAHETHRQRILFNPWITERVVAELPDLLLAADLSHWVCVGESSRLPGRVLEAMAPRVIHVDARVGHEEGPQVADPRHDRSAPYLEAHEGWWDLIWGARDTAGAGELIFCPEHGPVPYQPTDLDGRPLADIHEINRWMAARLRQRYAS